MGQEDQGKGSKSSDDDATEDLLTPFENWKADKRTNDEFINLDDNSSQKSADSPLQSQQSPTLRLESSNDRIEYDELKGEPNSTSKARSSPDQYYSSFASPSSSSISQPIESIHSIQAQSYQSIANYANGSLSSKYHTSFSSSIIVDKSSKRPTEAEEVECTALVADDTQSSSTISHRSGASYSDDFEPTSRQSIANSARSSVDDYKDASSIAPLLHQHHYHRKHNPPSDDDSGGEFLDQPSHTAPPPVAALPLFLHLNCHQPDESIKGFPGQSKSRKSSSLPTKESVSIRKSNNPPISTKSIACQTTRIVTTNTGCHAANAVKSCGQQSVILDSPDLYSKPPIIEPLINPAFYCKGPCSGLTSDKLLNYTVVAIHKNYYCVDPPPQGDHCQLGGGSRSP